MVKLMTLFALLVGLVPGVSAQETARGGLDSASVLLLKPDRFVRIQVPDLGRVQGRVGGLTGSDLVLQDEGNSRRVQLAAVDTLWIRGRATKTGAIIGAVLGIGAGVFLGALGEALCEYDCNHNYVLSGALIVGAMGGAAGAVIGTAIPRWRRVFPE
jgi:hypothetical protein